jgi:ABC-type sugar transport system permease subunit
MPWIIGFLVFTAYPMFYSLWLSFNKVKISAKGIITAFTGITNYTQSFLVDPNFLGYLGKYLLQIVLTVPLVLVFSVILAMLLNIKLPFKHFFRAIYFLPVILMSGPVLNELISNGADKIKGMQDFVVYKFITTLPNYLSTPLTYIFDNFIMILWFSGVQILIILMGLQKIDRNIYEAAEVDGASLWETFWKITLPTLKPFIFINALYTIVDISGLSLNPVINHIRANMNDPRTGYGYSSAMAWVYFAVLVILILIAYLAFGRGDKVPSNKKQGRRKKSEYNAAKALFNKNSREKVL